MAEVSFEDLAERLTPEAKALFMEMAGAHLESSGDRLFIRMDYISGARMHFIGQGSQRTFNDFDGGALEDLVSWGLLHQGFSRKGTPNYRVTGEGQRFYRWLMESQGAPIAQIEDQVRRVVDGRAFAESHPGASHHLREAFALLWSGRADEQVISEIGDHLRKALMDATTDAVGGSGKQEKPIQRLKTYLETLDLPSREAEVVVQVVELARAVLSLDHRLNHIRDEADLGAPEATWEEARRAAFTTALACYELDRLGNR